MKSLEIPAEKTRLIEVISFVLDYAKNLGFEKKELFQLKLCTEEIFVNVASYAYGADTESKAVKKFRYFTVDGHPLPDAEFILLFSTLQPGEVAVCGGRVWMRAFVGDR